MFLINNSINNKYNYFRKFVDKASSCYSTASYVSVRESLDYSKRIFRDHGVSRMLVTLPRTFYASDNLRRHSQLRYADRQRKRERERQRERERGGGRDMLRVSSTHRVAVDEPAERGVWLRPRRSAIEPHDVADLITMFPGSRRDNGFVFREG